MLFQDDQFKSVYDFENSVPCEYRNLKKLGECIYSLIDLLNESIELGKEIITAHTDNNGKTINIKSIPEKVALWTPAEIETVLYRKAENKSSIAQHLQEWGIAKEDTELFSEEYAKILYFFFVVQYIVFPDENIFILLSPENLSTDLSLSSESDNGKYMFFIKENIFDSTEIADEFVREDNKITHCIHRLSYVLDQYIDPKNYASKDYLYLIDDYISASLKEFIKKEKRIESPLMLAADYVYSYQIRAYISELISNLSSDDSIFHFEEIENDINPSWKEEFIEIDGVIDCLKQPDIMSFYMQSHTHRPKYFDVFIDNILWWDAKCLMNYKEAFWIKKVNDDIAITKYDLGLIAKTFMDLSTTHYGIRIKRTRKKWDNNVSFRKALTEETMQDMAGRYFVIAYESEKINAEWGPGSYWLLFKPYSLKKYVFAQKVMKSAFEIKNLNMRHLFLEHVTDRILRELNSY